MAFQEESLAEIHERLAKLERQNRRLKLTGVAVLVGAASLAFMGQASKSKTVEANEIILRDAKGTARASLRVDEKTSKTELVLADRHGDNDVVLSADDSSGGTIVARKEGDVRAVGMTNDAVVLRGLDKEALALEPTVVTFLDSKNNEKAHFASNGLFVTDEQGFKAAIGTQNLVTPGTGETHKTSAASLALFDKDKNVIWRAP
jgi:hypothetical protein